MASTARTHPLPVASTVALRCVSSEALEHRHAASVAFRFSPLSTATASQLPENYRY